MIRLEAGYDATFRFLTADSSASRDVKHLSLIVRGGREGGFSSIVSYMFIVKIIFGDCGLKIELCFLPRRLVYAGESNGKLLFHLPFAKL